MKKIIYKNFNSLSIVIPFFNEKKRLHLAFKNINAFIKKKYIYKIEIIFVDDGSTDKGDLYVKKFFKEFKKQKNISLKLIRIKKNNGKGYALKEDV